MCEYSSLPYSYSELCDSLPDGMNATSMLLDPEIHVDIINGRISANLMGKLKMSGKCKMLSAPSSRHDWVIDGDIIRDISAFAHAEV